MSDVATNKDLQARVAVLESDLAAEKAKSSHLTLVLAEVRQQRGLLGDRAAEFAALFAPHAAAAQKQATETKAKGGGGDGDSE